MWQLAPVEVQDSAQCAGHNPSTFDDVDDFTHPELDEPGRRALNIERRLRARVICAGCPVKAACLEWALTENITTGMLGGLAPGERRKLRRGGQPERVHPRERAHLVVRNDGDQIVRAFVAGSTLNDLQVDFSISRPRVLAEINRAVV